MGIGPQQRKALRVGQLLDYLRSLGVEQLESVPIYFPDEVPAVLAAHDAAEGMLILSDLAESPLPTAPYVVGELGG